MYVRQKHGEEMEDIKLPDYPQLREILLDLSNPSVWETMLQENDDVSYISVARVHALRKKYHTEIGKNCYSSLFIAYFTLYQQPVEHLELAFHKLENVLRDLID